MPRRPGRPKTYATIFQRIVANTEVDETTGCWIWTGAMRRGYPSMNVRVDGKHKTISVHRAVLEEVHDIVFPFDEAGHLCFDTRCVNPDHLEVQAPAHNKADRRGYREPKNGARWIPIIFPRAEVDPARAALEAARAFDLESGGELVPADADCPF